MDSRRSSVTFVDDFPASSTWDFKSPDVEPIRLHFAGSSWADAHVLRRSPNSKSFDVAYTTSGSSAGGAVHVRNAVSHATVAVAHPNRAPVSRNVLHRMRRRFSKEGALASNLPMFQDISGRTYQWQNALNGGYELVCNTLPGRPIARYTRNQTGGTSSKGEAPSAAIDGAELVVDSSAEDMLDACVASLVSMEASRAASKITRRKGASKRNVAAPLYGRMSQDVWGQHRARDAPRRNNASHTTVPLYGQIRRDGHRACALEKASGQVTAPLYGRIVAVERTAGSRETGRIEREPEKHVVPLYGLVRA